MNSWQRLQPLSVNRKIVSSPVASRRRPGVIIAGPCTTGYHHDSPCKKLEIDREILS